jgi:hypothetical protein
MTMSEYTISIPNTLYEKAQRLAKQASQSVDEIICAWLEGALDQPLLDLLGDEQAGLQAMSYLSTEALWTIAREQMQPGLQQAMSHFMEKNSKSTITDEEFRDLSALVERGQRLTLRKSRAMKLLLDRSYAVSIDVLTPIDECVVLGGDGSPGASAHRAPVRVLSDSTARDRAGDARRAHLPRFSVTSEHARLQVLPTRPPSFVMVMQTARFR